MKHRLVIVVGLALLGCVALLAQDKDAPAPPPKEAPAAEPATAPAEAVKDKGSYCLGLLLGRDLKKQKMDLNLDHFLKGLRDGMTGGNDKITDDEVTKAIQAFQEEHMKHLAAENLKTGKAFLERTRKIEGVKVTPSGLQYMVVRAGTGERPKLTDTVVVHYRGTHIDNTVFDSSYSRGKPEVLPVSGVIAGWTEALQLMQEGAKWKLFIPAELAYGKKGSGEAVGPNEVLIFEVELIQIKDPAP